MRLVDWQSFTSGFSQIWLNVKEKKIRIYWNPLMVVMSCKKEPIV